MEKSNKQFLELENEQQEILNVLYERLGVVEQALLDRVMMLQTHMNTLERGEEVNEGLRAGQPIPQFIFTEDLKEGVIMNPQDDIFVVGTKKGQSVGADHPGATLTQLHQFA